MLEGPNEHIIAKRDWRNTTIDTRTAAGKRGGSPDSASPTR